MTLFRRPTVDFEAIQFTGDNFDEIRAHVGTRPAGYNDTAVIEIFNPIGTYLLHYSVEEEENPPKAELWDADADQWRPVCVGDWIVQQDEGWLSVTDEWMNLNNIRLDDEMLALIREMERPKTFQESLTALINHHTMENTSGTPDFLLAEYLMRSLQTFNAITRMRAQWRGESVELPALQSLRANREQMDRVIAYLRSKVEEGVIHLKEPLEATDIYREIQDYKPPAESGHFTDDLAQGGLEAGDTQIDWDIDANQPAQGPDVSVDLGTWEPQKEDGKEVPLVVYTNDQRNEIGTATIHVTPGEVLVTGTITGAIPQFGLPPELQHTEWSEPKDEPVSEAPTSRFDVYQKKGLTKNDD